MIVTVSQCAVCVRIAKDFALVFCQIESAYTYENKLSILIRCSCHRRERRGKPRAGRYDAQVQMLQAECDRNTQMATAQFQQ